MGWFWKSECSHHTMNIFNGSKIIYSLWTFSLIFTKKTSNCTFWLKPRFFFFCSSRPKLFFLVLLTFQANIHKKKFSLCVLFYFFKLPFTEKWPAKNWLDGSVSSSRRQGTGVSKAVVELQAGVGNMCSEGQGSSTLLVVLLALQVECGGSVPPHF